MVTSLLDRRNGAAFKIIFPIALLWMSILAIAAEEEEQTKKKNWTNQTELSAVQTDGNSEAGSLGFTNNYVYAKGRSRFSWDVLAIRVETTSSGITATGTPENPVFVENKNTTTASENYRSLLKYERTFSERTAWFISGSWEQDEPKGINSRSRVVLGLANKWKDTEKLVFSTHYGVGYDREDLRTADLANDEKDYMTADLGFELMVKLRNGQFDQKMNGDMSEEDSDDWRIRLANSLSFNLNKVLATKLSVNFEYNNVPNFTAVDLGDTGQKVNYQLEELDTQVTAALVINF